MIDMYQIVKEAGIAALDKRATDIVILNLQNISDITDFFLICTGTTTKHLCAIIESIEHKLSSFGIKKNHVEGYPNSNWILIDFYQIIVHVFTEEKRKFYDLEHLWGDTPRLEINE